MGSRVNRINKSNRNSLFSNASKKMPVAMSIRPLRRALRGAKEASADRATSYAAAHVKQGMTAGAAGFFNTRLNLMG